VPSLTLDAPAVYSPAQKRAFAERLGAVYAEVMRTDLETITVIVHDRGEGTVWRCGAAGPVAAALLMCDVRRGRSVAVREQLCRRMLVVCEEVLGIEPSTLKIEFTQPRKRTGTRAPPSLRAHDTRSPARAKRTGAS
jgi:phenylpyruvate tautomerase PptA (4-oxalocrotonate tautomerase family)